MMLTLYESVKTETGNGNLPLLWPPIVLVAVLVLEPQPIVNAIDLNNR